MTEDRDFGRLAPVSAGSQECETTSIAETSHMVADRSTPSWWNQRYLMQDTPWDTGVIPPELHELADSGLLRPPGVALDVGCGTGTNTIFLARLGFTAIGVDFAWSAAMQGRDKALAAGLPPLFCVGDAANLGFLAIQAHFALDMGCLHSLVPDARARYAESLAQRMVSGGLYLMYGFDLDPDAQGGPAGFAPGEIEARFSPHFRLHWRRPSVQGERAVAWYLLERL